MTQRLPPFKSIEAFVLAAQTLSFTNAALSLHITVPAVSRRIQALEAELGVVLFHRLHRTLKLTPEGQTYVEKLAPAIDAIRHASDSVRSAPRGNSVHLSIPASLAGSWLFPRLLGFRSAHRGIQIKLETAAEQAQSFRSDIDLSIQLGSGNWPGQHADTLLDLTVFPVCAPELLSRQPPLASPADLVRYPLIGLGEHPELWTNLLRAAGVAEPATLQTTNFESSHLLYEAASNGLGVATGVDVLVQPYLDSGRLVRLFDIELKLPKKFYIVSHPHSIERLPVRILRSWLLAEAAAWRSRKAGSERREPAALPAVHGGGKAPEPLPRCGR